MVGCGCLLLMGKRSNKRGRGRQGEQIIRPGEARLGHTASSGRAGVDAERSRRTDARWPRCEGGGPGISSKASALRRVR